MGETAEKTKLPDSTMSLGDHLEELRTRVILASIGLILGVIIGLFVCSPVIKFIEKPYFIAMQSSEMQNNDANSPSAAESKFRLQTLSPADGFTSYVKIALIIGIIISSPWVFYHLWMFVAAGLYPHERKYVYIAVPFTVLLFITGAIFFLVVIAPITLKFLIGFNEKYLGVKSEFAFKDYISFISWLTLVFGLSFQTPLVIFVLNRIGLVSVETLGRHRKYVVLIIVILAAAITPSPDVFSQIALAIPLYLLYELGILMSYLAERRKKLA